MRQIMGYAAITVAILVACLTWAADTKPAPSKPAPAGNFPIAPLVDNYAPVISPAFIAPTPGTIDDPKAAPAVVGQPTNAKSHPCTIWDGDDVAHYRQLLKTDKDLQAMLAGVKANADKRITQPLNVPGGMQGADGKWLNPDDFPAGHAPKASDGNGTQARNTSANVYAFTGDARYAEYCRKMLLAYGESYPKWARPKGTNWRAAYDGRLGGVFLDEGMKLAHMAWAYDLIHDLPSFTANDRSNIDAFFRLAVTPFFAQWLGGHDYLSTPDNRSCMCASAVLMAGYANEDQDLIDFGLNGHGGTKLQPAGTPGAGDPNPKELANDPRFAKTPGGLMGMHFTDACLLPDGLWNEGTPGYTLSIAGCGLFNAAESMWHHGVDMYRYRNGALKRLLDAGLLLSNPGTMTEPCLRDTPGPFSLMDKRDWLNGQIGSLYNVGYRRYHDAAYTPIIENAAAHLEMTIHSGPPLIKDNLPKDAVPAFAPLNVNFYAIGYGLLRIADGENTSSLLMQFSQEKDWAGGHDHPSRLGFELFTWGDTLAPFPGVIYPYEDTLNPKWYWTSISNCTMAVDQDSQLCGANRFNKYKGAPRPTAPQLVYAPAATLGMQRAYSSSIYPGTTQDRAMFMTSRYVADLFGGFATVERVYDLGWHFRGQVKTDLPLATWKFPDPVADGYDSLDNLKHGSGDKPWSAAITFHNKPLALFAAAGPATDVIFGDGYFDARKERPPTIIERREKVKTALFGNAIDISGAGYVKGVTQEGGLDAGYALLKVQTARGTDLCFAAYRPGTYKAGDIETDAAQAMVVMSGEHPTALYLGGGKTLKTAVASITRSEPGLAYVEKLPDGSWVVGNPSSGDATITVTMLDTGKPFSAQIKGMGKVTLAVPVH